LARSVLVIDDDPTILSFLEHSLRRLGYVVRAGASGADLWRLLDEERPDVIILDVMLPDVCGIDLLAELRRRRESIPVILSTAYATVDIAVKAMKSGAYDFLVKPVDIRILEVAVRRATEFHDMSEEITVWRKGLGALEGMGEMVGRHPSMQFLYAQIENVAPAAVPVLISGESGTGKELVARALHVKSQRAGGPFVDVNCAAIPRELLESEMFGHEKGAFTGAYKQYVGCFERAHGGTLFLDEITEMDMQLQAKLLRVLQDGRFSRIGGDQRIATDVRIVSSTNRHIEDAIRDGKLREDVYYRLNVVNLHAPPLRERRSDIPLLAQHYLERFARLYGKAFVGFEDDAMEALTACPWRGNVRELINVIQQAVVLNSGERIAPAMLPAHVAQLAGNAPVEPDSETGDEESDGKVLPFWLTEKIEIEKALRLSNNNVAEAAKKLQLSQATLYRKIQKYDLERK
jgi:DNA-binding NtrC family response regulator